MFVQLSEFPHRFHLKAGQILRTQLSETDGIWQIPFHRVVELTMDLHMSV
jgi:hypothetical protein